MRVPLPMPVERLPLDTATLRARAGCDVVQRLRHVGFQRPQLVKILWPSDVLLKWPRGLACGGTTGGGGRLSVAADSVAAHE